MFLKKVLNYKISNVISSNFKLFHLNSTRWFSDDSKLRSKSAGNESESEIWLRNASEWNCGNISTFEDEFGNQIKPTGQLSDAFPLKTNKRRALVTKVKGQNLLFSFLFVFFN